MSVRRVTELKRRNRVLELRLDLPLLLLEADKDSISGMLPYLRLAPALLHQLVETSARIEVLRVRKRLERLDDLREDMGLCTRAKEGKGTRESYGKFS
jgi:hypothetical protein